MCPALLTLDPPPPPAQRAPQRGQGPPGPSLMSLSTYRSGGVSPQTAALGDPDEDDEEDDEGFVEVPEKEGYEACVPDHLWPKDGEWRVGALRTLPSPVTSQPESSRVMLHLCPGCSLPGPSPRPALRRLLSSPAGQALLPLPVSTTRPSTHSRTSEGPQLGTQACADLPTVARGSLAGELKVSA